MSKEQGGGGQLKEEALARAGICGLLARVFSAAPTAGLLAGIRESGMQEMLASLGLGLDEGFFAADDGGQVERLAVEFTRLFVGPGQHIAPYESVFIGGEGEDAPRLMGQAARAAAEFYREAGLELKSGSEMPDHIGVELEALAELARLEACRRGDDDAEAERLWRLQQRFAREHLELWLPLFCREVERRTENVFYRRMAELALMMLQLYRD